LATTILIADDTALFRALLSDALQEQGYAVFSARDGKEALAALLQSPDRFDLAILDLEMPEKTGVEVLEGLRAAPAAPSLPVLALTGHEFDQERFQRLRELGAAGYISKGSSMKDILERVRATLCPERAPGSDQVVEAYALVEYSAGDQTWNGITRTIGADHLFVRTTQGQPVGTRLRLSLVLPEEETRVEAEGVVDQCVPYTPGEESPEAIPGLKVQWVSMSPESRAALDAFLRSRA
jgi:DNA-binding response OmpR family regulator